MRRAAGPLLLAALALLSATPGIAGSPEAERAAGYRGPVIDVHLHAFEWDRYGSEPPPNAVTGRVPQARSDEAAARASAASLERAGVVKAVASGPRELLGTWREAAPERVLPALYAQSPGDLPPVEELRRLVESGRVAVLGELAPMYAGGTLADEGWEPYLALAEELGLPVAVHTGLAPPRSPYGCCPELRTGLGRPSHVEEVLVRHPELRVYLMHAGWPWLEETKALMAMYPRLRVDVAVVDWVLPRAEFHAHLEALVEAGYEDRILFGSDQMIWPDAIGLAIEGVDSAPFLSAEQKRKIFHDNAARFLGLEEPEGGAP